MGLFWAGYYSLSVLGYLSFDEFFEPTIVKSVDKKQ